MFLNKSDNIYYCSEPTTRCSINYCKECDADTNNVCQECYQDYEVNIVTGSCIKKTEKVPSITWEDIYKPIKNCTKKIKNEYYKGLCLELKGITTSQIAYGHAFFVIMNFEKKRRMRNLDEEKELIKMNGICQSFIELEESKNVNSIDYSCIFNNTNNIDINSYKGVNIEEGDNNQKLLLSSNLKELSIEIFKNIEGLENLANTSSFTLEDLLKIITFTINEPKDVNANKYKFDFQFKGTLNNEPTNKDAIDQNLKLNENDANIHCKLTFGEQLDSTLNCDFYSKDYKDIESFSFKTITMTSKEKEVYIIGLESIKLINTQETFFDKYGIYLIIGGSILVVIIIVVIIIFVVKDKKKKLDSITPDSGIRKINKAGNNITAIGESTFKRLDGKGSKKKSNQIKNKKKKPMLIKNKKIKSNKRKK